MVREQSTNGMNAWHYWKGYGVHMHMSKVYLTMEPMVARPHTIQIIVQRRPSGVMGNISPYPNVAEVTMTK